MKLPRRKFLHLAAGAAGAPDFAARSMVASLSIAAGALPLVGFPAGNAPDIVARLIGQGLSERLGQQFVIENRPGAASNIATEAALSAPADGYTLLMIVLTNVLNATLYTNLKFNFIRDIAPIGGIADAPYLIVVNPSLPAKTIPEFIAYAKANPGKINYASGGNGSSSHIFGGELFKTMAGVDLVHVPYRSSFMPRSALWAGADDDQSDPSGDGICPGRQAHRAGSDHCEAPGTRCRTFRPSANSCRVTLATGWYGLCRAPRNTPAEIVTKLNEATNAALADPTMKARLAGLGVEPLRMTPEQFGIFVANDFEKWGAVIRSAGIKAE